MHIPDGFIDGKTAVTAAVLSLSGVGLALRQVKRELPPRKVPLLGLAAAFLFAAQMVNFPVAGGTSGHLIGGTLVAVLLGPSAAVVVLTTVLIVQCFLFQDGGVMALGANIFNMAIVNSIAGYAIYRLMCRWLTGLRGRVTALAFAAWCATVLAAISCAGQLAWSGTIPWTVAFPAMTTVHMLIGAGEGLISAMVFVAVYRARPDVVSLQSTVHSPQSSVFSPQSSVSGSESAIGNRQSAIKEVVGYGLLVTLGVAIFVAPFACSWPDGLESFAAKFGFEHRAAPLLSAPVPDYQIPGIHWAVGATALAGAIGTLIVFGLALLLGRLLVPKPKNP